MKVSIRNEYGNLKSVIVGSVTNMAWPSDDDKFNKGIQKSTYPTTLLRGKLPGVVSQEAAEDLEKLVNILENRKIKVYRPLTNKPHWAYSARDILLTIGNKVIQCPTPFSSRADEIEMYPFLYKADAEIIKAPSPIKDSDPYFDAANVLKLGDKLLYSLSHSANDAGADWLQQQVGNEHEVIKWSVVDHDITHIDSTLLTLNENTVIVNATRVKEQDLPQFMRDYKKIWIEDVVPRDFHQFPYASKWIGMNILSIDPETVLVDEIQTGLKEKLEANNFKVITTSMRQSRTLGGGFHCVTCDLERE
jgi:glycine amidinotransferase/scyllo-inosamine-4-phosphate amidinotransferase 1